MLSYIVKRLLLLLVTLFGITALTFAVTRLTPGDPAALKIQGGVGGAATAVGGYNDLVELNRRNLGLDKPMLLNLDFEDGELLARRALDDYLRQPEFWSGDGRKRLMRVSTIALGPALERFALVGTAGELEVESRGDTKRDMASPEVQKGRLAEILPSLAAEATLRPPGTDPDVVYTFWKEWHDANKERYGAARVRQLVADYFSASDPARVSELQQDVYRAGGFAVPFLIARVGDRDRETRLRATRALQAQTGFTFLGNEAEFDARADDIRLRWGSWWRRERIAYSSFGPVRHAWHVIANTQFGLWCGQAASFDFGESYAKRRPVSTMMWEALPISILVAGTSILISYLIAIPLGILSAVGRHTFSDSMITLLLFILYSLPSFWVAGILLLTTTGPPYFDWFPTRGLNSDGIQYGADGVAFWTWLLDRAWHLVLPILCLTYGSLAFISRQMRSAMLEAIDQDFIRTAKAKGLPARTVILKHALRNSLIPILTISAGLLPELIGGAIIIESIFTIPGMGSLTFEAILKRDYPVINAVLFFSAFLTLLGILLADLSYAVADPRITYD